MSARQRSSNPIRMTQAELRALPEYSCSLPTGQTIGKRWKCDRAAYRRRPPAAYYEDWWIGEYVEDPDPEMIGIHWRKIIIMEPYSPPNRLVAWFVRVGLIMPPKMVRTVPR